MIIPYRIRVDLKLASDDQSSQTFLYTKENLPTTIHRKKTVQGNLKIPENLSQYADHPHANHLQSLCTAAPWVLAQAHRNMRTPQHPHHTTLLLVPD